jgi:transcriptional regulator with XRE-family HTH domain
VTQKLGIDTLHVVGFSRVTNQQGENNVTMTSSPTPDTPDFGARIKDLLRERNWNQSDLARATGLGRDSISTYINGTTRPTPKNLGKIAQALGVEARDLLPSHAKAEVNETILEMSQLPDGMVRLRVLKSVTLDQAVEIFSILKKK